MQALGYLVVVCLLAVGLYTTLNNVTFGKKPEDENQGDQS